MFRVTRYPMISKTESGRVGYRKKYRVAGRVRVPAGHCSYNCYIHWTMGKFELGLVGSGPSSDKDRGAMIRRQGQISRRDLCRTSIRKWKILLIHWVLKQLQHKFKAWPWRKNQITHFVIKTDISLTLWLNRAEKADRFLFLKESRNPKKD